MNPLLFFLGSHLKLRSLRQLSLSKDDRGFVLPLVIMIGLVLIVASLGIVASSQNSQKNTIAQKFTAQGLAIAETGVTRILDLMNQNRYISMFPDCVSRNSSTGVCNDASSSPIPQSWATVNTITSQIAACGTGTDLTKVTAIATNQSWLPVNSSNTDQGEYRLISYQYAPTFGVAPGTATLTVEGRATNSNQVSNSNSRLQVQIPVDPSPPLTTGVPGVWLSSGSTGSNTIQGDVLLGDCTTSPSTISVIGTDPLTNQPYTAKYTNLQFPDLPLNPSPANTLNNASGNITLPRAGDTAVTKTIAGQSVSVYEYRVNEIAFNSGSNNITITPGQRVTFYLDGSINVGANSDIIHKCTDSSNQAIAGCKPTDFQVFGYAQATGSPPTRPKICMSGNNRLDAFILAPAYTIGIAGSGGGVGGIKGTVWAYNWSNSGGCGSNTSNVVVYQAARWDEIGLQPKNVLPVLKNLSSWQRQQR